jgi:hypothetical protein
MADGVQIPWHRNTWRMPLDAYFKMAMATQNVNGVS